MYVAGNRWSGDAAAATYKDGRSLLTASGQIVRSMENLKRNYEKLTQEAGMLWALRDAIQTEISRHGINPSSREWIIKVEMIERELRELESRYNDEKKRLWRLDHFWKSSTLGKVMVEKHKQVQSLLEEGNLERVVLVTELPERVMEMIAPNIEGYHALYTVVYEVLSSLQDKKIRRVGIWGIVGTGKTTIMKNLNNHKDIAKMFDIVI